MDWAVFPSPPMDAVLQSEDIWLVMCPPTPPCGLSLTCSHCLSKRKPDREGREKWADPDHTSATFTVISAHFVIYKEQEGAYFIAIHLG